MARRAHRYYARKNPMTNTEIALLVGGVGILGFGIWYAISSRAAAVAGTQAAILQQGTAGAGTPTLAQVNAASGQAPLPGGWGAPQGSDVGSYAQWNQGQFQTAQGGTQQPTAAAAFNPSS
jgi:hypothetical protein